MTIPNEIRVSRLPASRFLDCFIWLTSHFLTHALAQQAVRLDEQDDDQDGEDHSVRQLGGDIRLGEDLDDAQQDATDHCARDGADTAENGCGECLDTGMEPVVGMSIG